MHKRLNEKEIQDGTFVGIWNIALLRRGPDTEAGTHKTRFGGQAPPRIIVELQKLQDLGAISAQTIDSR